LISSSRRKLVLRAFPRSPEQRLHQTGANRVTKHFLDETDVLQLLNEVVDRAGGQSAWARQTGVSRVQLNKAGEIR
jgi:hypothetical protein